MITLPIVISVLSLLLSIVAFCYSFKATKKASAIANDNLNIQYGMIELEVRKAIENATNNINNFAVLMMPLGSKEAKGTITDEEKHTLVGYMKILKSHIQTMLNNYESACAKYLDCKIDKSRFKKEYKDEIRNLFEDKNSKEYLTPPASKYKAIIKVYDEWENLEK